MGPLACLDPSKASLLLFPAPFLSGLPYLWCPSQGPGALTPWLSSHLRYPTSIAMADEQPLLPEPWGILPWALEFGFFSEPLRLCLLAGVTALGWLEGSWMGRQRDVFVL